MYYQLIVQGVHQLMMEHTVCKDNNQKSFLSPNDNNEGYKVENESWSVSIKAASKN